ncbi:phosphatase 2C-like domain-containing protein [Lactarius akahatsu]|uniref:Protein phosphatase n=1 Tax=Lactarius akahatsu TaxID=416441 RepID=A0AAD4LSY5_9AGAM|nr:phosphatase 2C-like domain-containing protein [Lactarius akahatsu]
MLYQLQSTGRVPSLSPRPISRASSALRTFRRTASTSMPRPYRFHVCANWLSAPPEHGMKKRGVPFPADSPVGIWRDLSLTWPRPGNSKTPGEDFFYVQEVRGISFGVADGVGGWASSGIDPSLFSQALMYHSHRYAKVGWAGEPEVDTTQDYEDREAVEGWELHPRECLKLAYQATLRERSVIAGSSTACLITLNASSGLLRAANLGDSGFMIIRCSSVFHRQRAQTHFFNCPKQLAKIPSVIRRSSGAVTDSPEDADVYETKLRDGDLGHCICRYHCHISASTLLISICQTDGLSDNVFNHEITSICTLVSRSGVSEEAQVKLISDRIVEYARGCMFNERRTSPFQSKIQISQLHDSEFNPLFSRGSGHEWDSL